MPPSASVRRKPSLGGLGARARRARQLGPEVELHAHRRREAGRRAVEVVVEETVLRVVDLLRAREGRRPHEDQIGVGPAPLEVGERASWP
jgi:hypothetical protein